MRVGIANEETWSFLHAIHAELAAHHAVSLFRRRAFRLPIFHTRINRALFHHDLQRFMDANDVVFFEWASALLAAATHLRKRCAIVARLHRYEMYRWLDHIRWDAVDRILLVSHAKRREFLAHLPEQAAKVVVVRPAVDLERFTPSYRPFAGNLGILCHLTPRKRVYDLILTFAELLQQRGDLHLHVAGGRHPSHGAYHEALLRLVRELGLEARVTFYGHVTETWAWYQHIDLFLSNSFSEGLQVAPIEAMASGCYVLSHFWDGADELLPADHLFRTNDELKARVLAFCELPESERQAQRRAMRAWAVERFDGAQASQQVRQVIESVGAAPAPQRPRRLPALRSG